MADGDTNYRLIGVTLDEATVESRSREIEQEREVAIYDLLEANYFEPIGSPGGPYLLYLGTSEGRLIFDVRLVDDTPHGKIMLSMTPLRRVIKDYFLICESYYRAIREAPLSQIEALDMGRRGVHDEGSGILVERLKGKIAIDFDTARRLFALICMLHMKA
jgi:uncharacterized protein (UPF0262 family)